MAQPLDSESSTTSELQADRTEDEPIGLLSLPPEVLLQVIYCTFYLI